MSKHQGPRADSRPYKALELLIAAGGTVTIRHLRGKLAPNVSASEFANVVLGSLERRKFVNLLDESVSITEAGRLYIDPPEPEIAAPVVIVPAPYRKPMQDLVKRVRQLPIRAGAFEYRDIPSRHGDQRVAFKPGFPGLGETQE